MGHKAVQECADTYHHQPVEDIRADDIADGDIITASQGSIDADGGLRSTGAHGDDGQTDDDAGDLQDPRQGGASLHEKVCTFDQKYKSYE